MPVNSFSQLPAASPWITSPLFSYRKSQSCGSLFRSLALWQWQLPYQHHKYGALTPTSLPRLFKTPQHLPRAPNLRLFVKAILQKIGRNGVTIALTPIGTTMSRTQELHERYANTALRHASFEQPRLRGDTIEKSNEEIQSLNCMVILKSSLQWLTLHWPCLLLLC